MAKKRQPSKIAAGKQPAMTPAEVRACFARWKRVNEFIAAERRALTPTQKFDHWIELVRWAKLFPVPRSRADQNRQVRERWNRLRRIYRDKT